jgi:hypothetical protein
VGHEVAAVRTVDPDEFLELGPASALIKVSPFRLGRRSWREKYQVPSAQIGGRVLYRKAALERWLRSR